MEIQVKILLLYFLVFLTLFRESTGCHQAKDHEMAEGDFDGEENFDSNRRKKRQVMELSLQDFFSQCFYWQRPRNLHWPTVVEYIIKQSSWFDQTDVRYCTGDRVDCWTSLANYLFKSNSNLLRSTMRCILSYGQFKGQFARQTHYAYGISTPRDSVKLDVSPVEFIQNVESQISTVGGPLIGHLPSLIELYKEDIGCSLGLCDCTGISLPPGEYCGQSWYTRIAAHTKINSPLRTIMVRATNIAISQAITRARRREQSRNSIRNLIFAIGIQSIFTSTTTTRNPATTSQATTDSNTITTTIPTTLAPQAG